MACFTFSLLHNCKINSSPSHHFFYSIILKPAVWIVNPVIRFPITIHWLGPKISPIQNIPVSFQLLGNVSTCIASWVIVFRSFPCTAKFTSWYSQVFNLWDVLPFLICSLVPRTYFVREDPVSGCTSLLSIFMASLLTLLSENLRGVISGQSTSEFGSLSEDGFSKHPWVPPKASSLQTRYSGWARLCLTNAHASS